MATPANATYKQVQRSFRERANAYRVLYAQGPKGARGNKPARRVIRNGRLAYE